MNILTSVQAVSGKVPDVLNAASLSNDFLRDESKMEGKADFVAFPSTTDEVSVLMKWAAEENLQVTFSGGRTGIAGGAVPAGGLLLSLAKMKSIGKLNRTEAGELTIRCSAGILLSELETHLTIEKTGAFFPPDPTETSANIGGMIACNASGAHTFAYGPTRKYVKAITVVLANGEILNIERGQFHADGDNSFIFHSASGSQANCRIPSYKQPLTKNAAGYYSGDKMDLIDLFIGSEGTLGVITEAELMLLPKPEAEFNCMFFTSSEKVAVELTKKLRENKNLNITAIEYFDPLALAMLRRKREKMGAASAIPPGLPENPAAAGIYIDATSSKADAPALAKAIHAAANSIADGRLLADWAAFDKDERERLRKFRHALPETVNSLIAERRKTTPGLTKLGTDMAVPDECLSDILAVYRKELDSNNLDYVIFGHIGNNHLHVNILPATMEQYKLGKELYMKFASRVLEMGGSISAEHGIGKLKKNFLAMMLGEKGIAEMKTVKQVFDPQNRLGTGTLF